MNPNPGRGEGLAIKRGGFRGCRKRGKPEGGQKRPEHQFGRPTFGGTTVPSFWVGKVFQGGGEGGGVGGGGLRGFKGKGRGNLGEVKRGQCHAYGKAEK